MPNFTPNGIIYIGNVPFDNSYRHTMTFPSREAQAAYFASVCTQALARTDYTYIRMNNSIRVPFNAEQLYTYDYVMYKNANYGDKWFYAFIVAVNYVNENMTELVLELDVMQTWYFDYTLVEGMVEREHVNDDSLYAHLNPEPEMPFNLVCQDKVTDTRFNHSYVVVQTNATPHYENSANANSQTTVRGGKYSNIINGAAMYAFDPDPQLGSADPFYQFLYDLNECGAAASITNMFMFPQDYLNGAHPNGDASMEGSDNWSGYRVDRNTNFGTAPFAITDVASLDGYVPRNNKCFIYPYNFVRLEDNAGHHTELKYELWGYAESSQGNVHPLNVFVPLDPDATAFVVPTNYAGETTNYEAALMFPCTAKVSWTYSAYQTWSAQNHLSNVINGLAGAAMLAIPATRGISAASKALGVGAQSAKALTSRGAQSAGQWNIAKASLAHGYNSLSEREQYMGVAGAGMLGNLAGNIYRQSKIPDVQKGSSSGNSIYGVGKMTFNIKKMCMQYEFAQILDNFFDMYGYQVDMVKTPNRTGRLSWNYVKMQNSCHRGNVPASDMDKINSIYDAGITFWHTSDVGNYSLSNYII